ncbi:hypothetical protein [Swingsia samuiensis]|uniref:Uncharacterized protein n=1 Tax=Swingsia samuiensis TaxID=1293412 RepID=A0A4Y6UI14_9PROT|nr:hypothetical protein [Swingsia samuiensis]QDH17239.1 hypothetical protein E3D00_06450 [Swingsia samuiensis]
MLLKRDGVVAEWNMQNNEKILTDLNSANKSNDRIAYYHILSSNGDPYGALALGVVKQSTITGRVAKNFAQFIAAYAYTTLNAKRWEAISLGLMRADYEARAQLAPDDSLLGLSWHTIESYHTRLFEENNVPGRAWTAFIPLKLAGLTNAAQLWKDMLFHGPITIGLETTHDVLSPLAKQHGLQNISRNLSDLDSLRQSRKAVQIMTGLDHLSNEQSDALLWTAGILHALVPTIWETIFYTIRHFISRFSETLAIIFGHVLSRTLPYHNLRKHLMHAHMKQEGK